MSKKAAEHHRKSSEHHTTPHGIMRKPQSTTMRGIMRRPPTMLTPPEHTPFTPEGMRKRQRSLTLRSTAKSSLRTHSSAKELHQIT